MGLLLCRGYKESTGVETTMGLLLCRGYNGSTVL